MADARTDFILLYACDVRENPGAYKAHVRHDPEGSAHALTEGLDPDECRRLLADLRQERRAIRKLTEN